MTERTSSATPSEEYMLNVEIEPIELAQLLEIEAKRSDVTLVASNRMKAAAAMIRSLSAPSASAGRDEIIEELRAALKESHRALGFYEWYAVDTNGLKRANESALKNAAPQEVERQAVDTRASVPAVAAPSGDKRQGETPRTDAFYAGKLKTVGRIAVSQPAPSEWVEFARQLERELAEANDALMMKAQQCTAERLRANDAEKRAQSARPASKDAVAVALAQEMYLTLIGHPAYKLTISSGRVEIIARAYLAAMSPEWLDGIDKRFPKVASPSTRREKA